MTQGRASLAMHIVVVTIFPELVEPFARTGLLGKAVQRGVVCIESVNPRDFARDRHRTVDDAPYGGGSGMVMKPQPVVAAIEAAIERIRARAGGDVPTRRVLLTPQGELFRQRDAWRYASSAKGLVLVCGRYEGIDERVVHFVDEQRSIGDFVTMGGEVAALAIVEATARLIPGVVGNPESLREESHARGLLEYPHYTRPAVFRGLRVPEVLLSGDHAAIERWRRREALLRTLRRRPELLASAELTDEERRWLRELRQKDR